MDVYTVADTLKVTVLAGRLVLFKWGYETVLSLYGISSVVSLRGKKRRTQKYCDCCVVARGFTA